MVQPVQKLKCVYSNIQSFTSKRKEIELYVSQYEPDLLFFTEMWISQEFTASEYLIEGYQEPVLFLKNRGGSGIYIKNGIKFVQVNPPEIVEDSSWIMIKTKNGVKRLYGCLYRSPNSSAENNEKMLRNLSWARNNYSEVVLIGDFNLPSIDWKTEKCQGRYESAFIELINSLGFEQIITDFTRFRHGQNPSLLDLLLVSDANIVQSVNMISPFGKSDHVVIEFSVSTRYNMTNGSKSKFNIRKMDFMKFSEEMSSHDWNNMFCDDCDLDRSYNEFIEIVGGLIKKYAPQAKEKRRSIAPWSNRLISKLSEKKRRLWGRYRYTQSTSDYVKYRECLKNFNDEKFNAIRRFENKIISNKDSNPKTYHKYVSRKDRYKDTTISLVHDEEICSDEKKCADIFNEFFSSVFTSGSSNLSALRDIETLYPTMSEIDITQDLVRKKIDMIDTSKSTGPDGVPALLIKNAADTFTPILTKIYRLSYESGKVPAGMKIAHIKPLFKSGEKNSPNNYRPVSITSVLSKILESILKDHFETHIQSFDIMHTSQHGFCRGRSTSSNMLKFWNEVTDIVDKSGSVSIVYTDLRKAFDSVPHDLLIYKIQKYGIKGKNLKWIEDYLDGRSQRVIVGNEQSDLALVLSGVPQGGVLSGMLFALYINDLPDVLRHTRISMYADDAKIFAPIKEEKCISKVQEDLNALNEWCIEWRLRLNPQKCALIHYNPIRSHSQFSPQYYIGGQPVARSSETKDLGLLITDDLKFHNQVDMVCKKAYFEINRIRRSFITRSPKFLANMFKLYVRPHLEYCMEVWNPSYLGDIGKIERVQNRFTRLILGSRLMTHEQRNERLHISSHKERRLRGDMIHTFKNIHNPSMFKLRSDNRLRGNDKTLSVPAFRSDIKRHTLSYRNIQFWNELPNYVVNSEDLNSFKTNFDAFMIARA